VSESTSLKKSWNSHRNPFKLAKPSLHFNDPDLNARFLFISSELSFHMVFRVTIALLNKQNHWSATKFEEFPMAPRFTMKSHVKSITQFLKSSWNNCCIKPSDLKGTLCRHFSIDEWIYHSEAEPSEYWTQTSSPI
jgi:hypothetical protein